MLRDFGWGAGDLGMVRERKIGPNDEEDRDDQGLGSKGPGRADETIDDSDSDQTDKPTTDKGLGLGSTRSENDAVLRPKRIDEMIGQREVMEVLKIAIDAANKREDPLGHILLDGPPGLGKTTFAVCIPQELGVHVEMASGPSLKAPKEILPYLTNLQRRSVLFIDEIHRLPKPVEEFLYTAMEDFRVDIVLGEGVNARTLNLKLQPFTLIGATTRAGMLSGPLRDRFHIRQHLSYYNEEDLVKILERNAEKLRVEISHDASIEIAKRSRGTPRVANGRLLWVRDYAMSKSDGRINKDLTKKALEMLGIDELGLDRQDRKYLETISRVFQGGPAGLEAIAHTMGVSSDTLEDEVEPFLLRSEMIIRTQRGRMITGIGLKIGNAKG
ncbi:MAG: Holliday junction branch migration DNA helicase RuvB [Pirellula sp.]